MKLRKSESGAMYIEGRTWEDSPLEIYKRVLVCSTFELLRDKHIGFDENILKVIDSPIWYMEERTRVVYLSNIKTEVVRRH